MFERWMIVSDLDGTLLNHDTYDYSIALTRLQELEESGFPVIFNTSKTFAELKHFTRSINNRHPFVSENGSAIHIPVGYFPHHKNAVSKYDNDYEEIKLSQDFELIKSLIKQQRPEAIDFSQCSLQQAMDITGLDQAEAQMAQQRRFSVPLFFSDKEQEQGFSKLVHSQGLTTLKGGRFLHVQGKVNKGDALASLKSLYRKYHHVEYGVIALGDTQNDAAMLQQADIAVVVKSPSSDAVKLSNRELVIHTRHVAPEGWVEGVNAAFTKIEMITQKFKHLQENQYGG